MANLLADRGQTLQWPLVRQASYGFSTVLNGYPCKEMSPRERLVEASENKMEYAKTRAFWAVQLQGADEDLNEWYRVLQEPFDPVVVQQPGINGFVLKCVEFQSMTSRAEVIEKARIIVDKLNGAMKVTCGTGRISFNGLAEVMTDGTIDQTLFFESVQSSGRVGRVVVTTTGGPPNTAAPALAQKWIQLATTDGIVADMLRHLGNVPSWYDLYKIYEALRGLCKRSNKLHEKYWSPKQKMLGDFRHTANYYRHGLPHSARNKPPINPMPFDQAEELLRQMVNEVMDDLTLNTPTSSISQDSG